ncbi:MAG TPA: hypothetical protein VIL60_12420, partial [Rhodanobacter sp.]
MATDSILQAARESLERIQTFDAKSLGRNEDLGRQLNFEEAIDTADRLIRLYQRISIATLDDL